MTPQPEWISAAEVMRRHTNEASLRFPNDRGAVKSERLNESADLDLLDPTATVVLVRVGAKEPREFPKEPVREYLYEQNESTHRYRLITTNEVN